MKIRLGFISNSSSSSYIIGIGKIVNLAKLIDWADAHNIREISIARADGKDNIPDITGLANIMTTTHLKRIGSSVWQTVGYRGDHAYIIGAVNSEPKVSTKLDPNKDELYLIVEAGNNEGDTEFYDEATEEMNWDIDPEFFQGLGDQYNILKLLMEPGDILEDVEYRYGAERNG